MPGSTSSRVKTQTQVKTDVREYVDDEGRKVRETTKTTTTITMKVGSNSTSTKTEVNTEYIDGNTSGNNDRLNRDMGQIKLDDNEEKKKVELKFVDKKKFREECLERHNELRRKHGVPDLKSNSKLDEKAQKWADRLLQIHKMQHSNQSDLGENVAFKRLPDNKICTGAEITDMWYNEIEQYDFEKAQFASNTGHFTQVVWKDSKEIGVGVATDGKGVMYVVANYSPPGNFRGKFADNVLKKR